MELDDLYQDVILDHGRHPRHFAELDDATATAEGFNPLCGDRLKVYIKQENGMIVDAAFTGEGCAISMASTSLLLEKVIGMSITEAKQLFSSFVNLVTDKKTAADVALGKLEVMQGVTKFPMRIKCATLGCHAIEEACSKEDT